jgi:hypothetical protein
VGENVREDESVRVEEGELLCVRVIDEVPDPDAVILAGAVGCAKKFVYT